MGVGVGTDVRVKCDVLLKVVDEMRSLGMNHSVIIDDLEKAVQDERDQVEVLRQSSNGFNYYNYNRLTDVRFVEFGKGVTFSRVVNLDHTTAPQQKSLSYLEIIEMCSSKI